MHYFKYKWTIISTVNICIVIIAFIIFIGVAIIINREDLYGGLAFIAGGCLLFAPLYVNARLMMSDVEVDPQSIKWIVYGWVWKEIKWSEVKKVRTERYYNIAVGRNSTIYSISQTVGRRS